MGSDGIARFFLFMHEVLCLIQRPEYRKIRANSRSRQKKLTRSNYWSEVHPMLAEQAPKQAFVIADSAMCITPLCGPSQRNAGCSASALNVLP